MSVEHPARTWTATASPATGCRSTGAVLERLYVDERLGVKAVAARLGVSQAKVRGDLAHHGMAVRRPGRPARHPAA